MFRIIFRRQVQHLSFAIILSCINFLLFHYPFFRFVFSNLDSGSFTSAIITISLVVLMLVANAFAFYVFLFMARKLGQVILALFFIISAFCLYFIITYGVIIDESMIGNVFNTKYEEASGFLSYKMILYVLGLGVLPAIYILRVKILWDPLRKGLIRAAISLLFIILMVFLNASNWLWIDKHSKQLGGLAMPWSYSVNIPLLFIHRSQKNQKEIPLPTAKVRDSSKAVFVLVIGESARRENFSLYGYPKNTNPLLSTRKGVKTYLATSDATYTTAGVKSILEDRKSSKLYEILPNYLYRSGVDVVWRTTNWGEPPVHVPDYENKPALEKLCKGANCRYDELLLTGLKERIRSSKKSKVLIILHTSTSHGPTYSKKYPPKFEKFRPVCNSVELGECPAETLINAYDNTIVYTDYILATLIDDLQDLPEYKSAMLFVSDHGESLGEKNLYMHGLPISIAPKQQYEIPFIAWSSDSTKVYKHYPKVTQHFVFHSVLNFLDIESPVYDPNKSIFN